MASRRVQLFGSLCGLVFLVNLARVVYAPLLEPLRAEFGLSASAAGTLATLAWAGSAAPRLPAGWALTRVPRHWVVLVSGVVLAVAAGLAALAQSFATLAIGAFLLGIASGAYFIAANPLVTELFPERVGRALGVHGMASQIAAVAAPAIVSVLLLAFTWRSVFVSMAVAGVLVTVAVLIAAGRTDLPDAGDADRAILAAAVRQWRLVLTGVIIVGATGVAWNGVFNFYVTYLIDAKGFAAGDARGVLTLVFAAGVPAFLVGGDLVDRFPHVPIVLGTVGTFALSLLWLTATASVLAVLAATVVVGFSIHTLFPAIDAYLLDTLPDEHRASAYAVFSASMMTFQAGGSVLVGVLRDAGVPWEATFRGLALATLATTLGMAALYLAGKLPTGGRPPTDEGAVGADVDRARK